ncbi:hypothetical protein G6F68_009740 [Rhizopus microsporus]|nr:hypothetical protein G6F68_009740 [Rhizopus microsporus]
MIPSELIAEGDLIKVLPGDKVPADGNLFSGSSTVDESMVTGEVKAIPKEINDAVIGGTVNGLGTFIMKATRVGSDTALNQIIRLVEDAQVSKAPIQSYADKVARYFVPIVVLLGLVTFCIWSLVINFLDVERLPVFLQKEVAMDGWFFVCFKLCISVIIVACPCSLGLATPTAVMVGTGLGAEHGILFKGADVLENSQAVSKIIFDKTGTLTLNKLIVDKPTIKSYAEFDADGIVQIAAYASRTENQDAIDFCIVNSLAEPKLAREGIEELAFEPFNPTIKRTEITYRKDGQVYRATKGMSHFILDLCTRDKTEEQIQALNDDVDEFARRGLRSLAVAIEDDIHQDQGSGFRLIGLLPIYDPPRSDTKETIDRAIELGVQVKMITGDQLAIAKETGRRLGMGDNMFLSKTLKEGPPAGSGYSTMDDLVLHADGFAGVYPEHKYEIVQRLQAMGHMCAMTGDGVNDAPALSKSNVGIAVADASDAARSAADIVLTEPGLSVIIEALIHSRQIFQRMRNYSIYTCSVTIRVVTNGTYSKSFPTQSSMVSISPHPPLSSLP